MQYPSLHALYPKHSPIGWTVISYLGLCAILLWPLWTGNQVVGMLTVDMADTLYFQRSVFEYWFGNQAEAIGVRNETLWMWLPNWMDHLTMLPLMGLPFPWSANLWFLFMWASGGLAAHFVAKRCGASLPNAILCGVSWLFSESILRELNLFHAPQSMTMVLPLFLLALIRWTNRPSSALAVQIGVFFGVSALIYWYNAIFLSILFIPALLQTRNRTILWALVPLVILCSYPLWGFLSLQSPLVNHSLSEDVQRGSQWLVADRSFRVSVVLALACLVHCFRHKKDWPWFVLLAVTVLLSSGGMLWVVLQELHPILERLHWPERWAVLVPLLMLPMLSKVKYPLVWLGLSILESGLISPNLPIKTTNLKPYQCLSQLAQIDGMLIEVGHLNPKQGPWIALHQRFHSRNVPGALAIPPQHQSKSQWTLWPEATQWESLFSGQAKWNESVYDSLNANGINAILLMPPPLSALSQAEYNRYQLQLSTHLGPAEDLGCGHLWWTGEAPFSLNRVSAPSAVPTPQNTEIERLDSFVRQPNE